MELEFKMTVGDLRSFLQSGEIMDDQPIKVLCHALRREFEMDLTEVYIEEIGGEVSLIAYERE